MPVRTVVSPDKLVRAILGEFYVPNRSRVYWPNGDSVSWVTQREMENEKANGLWDKRHNEPERYKKAKIRALKKFLYIALQLFEDYKEPVCLPTLTRYAHRVFYGGCHQKALIELERALDNPTEE